MECQKAARENGSFRKISAPSVSDGVEYDQTRFGNSRRITQSTCRESDHSPRRPFTNGGKEKESYLISPNIPSQTEECFLSTNSLNNIPHEPSGPAFARYAKRARTNIPRATRRCGQSNEASTRTTAAPRLPTPARLAGSPPYCSRRGRPRPPSRRSLRAYSIDGRGPIAK